MVGIQVGWIPMAVIIRFEGKMINFTLIFKFKQQLVGAVVLNLFVQGSLFYELLIT